MTSTCLFTPSALTASPSVASVSPPRFAATQLRSAGEGAAPSAALAPAPRAVPRSADAADPSVPVASRPRFRRLVVFTGQLS